VGDLIGKATDWIVTKRFEINDIIGKPPATIEWE